MLKFGLVAESPWSSVAGLAGLAGPVDWFWRASGAGVRADPWGDHRVSVGPGGAQGERQQQRVGDLRGMAATLRSGRRRRT